MNFNRFLFIGCLAGWLIATPAWASLTILACEPEWKALADVLGGDKVTVDSATNAFQDPHHIEARPSLIVKARQADMIFCTGAELEVGWLPLLVQKSVNPKIQINQPGYFLATEHIELIEKPDVVDRSQGDVHADGNPHVHLDPYRLLTIAERFTERLQLVSPEHSDYFQQQHQLFSMQWQAAITEWETQAAQLKGKKAVVYHKNWSYLLTWLGIEAVADLEPKPGIPPNSAHLAMLVEVVKNQQPDFIVIANYQDAKGAKWLAKKTGLPLFELPFTVGGNLQSADLFGLYNSILDTLIEEK
jgi:zinc/manganese transport system substrate-binding protein